MAALLILRCIGNKKIEDTWIAMNVDKCGAFDDIILCIRMKNKTIIYLIQLKHQMVPENITAREFRAKDSGFRLPKYYDTILEIKKETNKAILSSQIMECFKQNWDNLIFILFTNRDVNENDSLKRVDKKSDIDVEWFLYENIDTNNGKVYLFDYDKLKVEDEIRKLIEEKFFLFIKQIHIDKIDIEIENAITKIIHPLKLPKNLQMELNQKFLLFITNWSIGDLGGYYPLTKNHVLRVILDLLITPHKLFTEECEVKETLEDSKLWKEMIEDKKVTIIEEDDVVIEYLKKFIAGEIKNYCDDPKNKNLWKKHTDVISKAVLRNVARAKKDIRFSDAYECLWKNGSVPLLLVVNEDNLKEIKTILNILKAIKEPLRVILISNCLVDFADNKDSFVSLQSLKKECYEKILNYPVKLQGRSSVKLVNFISNNMLKFITVRNIIYILSDKFNIGNDFSALPDIFIERTLERAFLDSKVLEEEIEDIFIIKCDSVDDFFLFVKKYDIDVTEIQVFSENATTLNSRIVIYDSRNKFIFEKLEQSDVPMHYLLLHPQGRLEWMRSVGCVKNIIKFRKNVDFINFYQNVHIFTKKSLSYIISAYPGMGKSVLMDDIAHCTPTDTWVLKINLFQYIEYYKSEEFEEADALEYLQYFNNRILEQEGKISDLNEIAFQKYLNCKKIITLLDGFDEVPVNLQKKVEQMLKSLQDSEYITYITTRPILRLHLEELLGTFAISINPFTRTDQETFLNHYFLNVVNSSNLNHEAVEKVPLFVDKLLTAAKHNLNDYEQEFTGVPLQTQLLAEVFTNDFIKFIDIGSFECEYFDLLYLYKNFINHKIKIVCDRFGSSTENILYRYKMHRSLCALQVLFPPDYLKNLNIQQLLEFEVKVFPDTLQLVQKDGIVIAESATNITFVHRTFAEYLAAEWLSENIDTEHKEVAISLVRHTFDSNFEVVRNIFDRILAKRCSLHLAIINRQTDIVKEIIDSGKFDTKVDKGKRSFLHLIGSWGMYHPQKSENDNGNFENKVAKDAMLKILKLVPNEFLKMGKDSLLNATPIDYAILSGSLNIADEMCSRLEHIDDYISIAFDVLGHITYYLNKCNYSSFASVLIKHSIVTELRDSVKKLKANHKDKTSIQYNIIQGNIKNVSVILTTEPEIDKIDELGYSLLHISSIFDQFIISQMLLVNKEHINIRDQTGKTPLHWACALGNLKTLTLLLSNKVDVNILDYDGMSALHYAIIACSKNKDVIIIELLKANADLTILDYHKKTPLHYALHYNHIQLLKILINYGANINLSRENSLQKILCSKDSDGGTILHWAADKGCIETVKLLLQYGADVTIEDNDGNTPLHWAVQKDHVEIVRLLLIHHKHVDIPNTSGVTPLHLAAHYGHESIVHLLLTIEESLKDMNNTIKSAKIEGKDVNGDTALIIAASNDQTNVSKLLLSKNANIEARNDKGMSPLLCASENGYNSIIELMLSNNANIETKNIGGMNSLHYAAETGNNYIIELLLSRQANIEAKDNGGATALLLAVLNGQVDSLEILLSKNADIQVVDNKCRSALHYATSKGHKNIVEILLSRNINMEIKEEERGETALHYAAYAGNIAIVELLISRNASIDAQTKNGETALHYAASNGHNDIVKYLLLKNANIELQNRENRTPLFSAIYFGHADTTDLLFSKNANIEARDEEGNTPLLRAAYLGHLVCIKLLLTRNVDLNAKSNDGNNALLRAAYKCRKEIIELLLSKGIDVNCQNDLGNSALHLAAYNGQADLVELLLSYNANIELKDQKGNTALIYAAFNGQFEIVKTLLWKDADNESKNKKGETPLLYAVEAGHTDVVDLLLFKNTDIEVKNDNGNTALLSAAFHGHIDIVNLLLLKHANIHVKNIDGNTPLHRAAYNGHKSTIELLLSNEANPEAENYSGLTAYDLAAFNNHIETLELFLTKTEDAQKECMKTHLLQLAICNGLTDTLKFILIKGVDIEMKWNDGQNALLLAAYFGHSNIADIVISTGAKLNITNDSGNTALHVAADQGHTEIVNLLLSNGASLEIKNENELSAFNLAELGGHSDVVDLFLNKIGNT